MSEVSRNLAIERQKESFRLARNRVVLGSTALASLLFIPNHGEALRDLRYGLVGVGGGLILEGAFKMLDANDRLDELEGRILRRDGKLINFD